MKEMSMHILDIATNSVRAKAKKYYNRSYRGFSEK